MKIRFQKFAPTAAFKKLFGRSRSDAGANNVNAGEAADAYEYYYKRGNTYYFRDSEGNKFTVDYKKPQQDLVRGNRYKIDMINNQSS